MTVCDKCGAPLTTAMMAVFCPHRDACAFMPDDKQGREFIRLLRGEDFDFDKLTGADQLTENGAAPSGLPHLSAECSEQPTRDVSEALRPDEPDQMTEGDPQ